MEQQSDKTTSKSPPDNQECESLHLDYEQTTELFRMLADIRFKLLAFIPLLTGVAVSLLNADKVGKWTALAVGILGFVVVLGIIIYELRNSLFHDLSISRASRLEGHLKLPRFTKLREGHNWPGGVFTERPPRKDTKVQYGLSQKFLGLQIKHDRGLALVYGASLGGWTFIVMNALINVLSLDDPWRFILSLSAGIIVAGITIYEFNRLDDERHRWQFGRGDRQEGHVKRVDQYKRDQQIQ